MDKINIMDFSLKDEMPICSNFSFLLPEEYSLSSSKNINALFDGSIKKSNDIYYLKGICTYVLELPCSKCLEEVCENLSLEILEKFSSDLAIIESDDEVISFTGQEFDIVEALFRNIILNIPQNVLCSEECKGLCIVCGGNKNLKDCNCVRVEPSVFDDVLKFFED
ncbi:MAG: YceD family protein [Lachnospirales bacterium]